MLGAMFGIKARTVLWASLVALVVAYAWHDGHDTATAHWQAKEQQRDLELSKAKADALEAIRALEAARMAAITEVTHNAKEEIDRAATAAAAANARGDRLHDQAQRLARASGAACATGATATHRGAAAATNALVLADVLRRADQRAGELAAAYDRARAAGLACERAYAIIVP